MQARTFTEYTVFYMGLRVGVSFNDQADCADYIERGVNAGVDRALYRIATREVTVVEGDWQTIETKIVFDERSGRHLCSECEPNPLVPQHLIERCGCTPELEPLPFDEDGDGIGEVCRRCGAYIALVADTDVEPLPEGAMLDEYGQPARNLSGALVFAPGCDPADDERERQQYRDRALELRFAARQLVKRANEVADSDETQAIAFMQRSIEKFAAMEDVVNEACNAGHDLHEFFASYDRKAGAR